MNNVLKGLYDIGSVSYLSEVANPIGLLTDDSLRQFCDVIVAVKVTYPSPFHIDRLIDSVCLHPVTFDTLLHKLIEVII